MVFNYRYKLMKRLFDLIFSMIFALLLAPVMLIIALFIYLSMGKPIIFVQTRTGLNEKPFNMFKFRTMSPTLDENGKLLSDRLRVTKLGLFLRSSSLDELPELWNVIKGEMSVVGPRPLLIEYLPLYSEVQRKRHLVKPGITGWAQINGRNNITWKQRFQYDVWYVENQTILLDFVIIFKSIKKVVTQKDALPSNEITMGKFEGNDKKK